MDGWPNVRGSNHQEQSVDGRRVLSQLHQALLPITVYLQTLTYSLDSLCMLSLSDFLLTCLYLPDSPTLFSLIDPSTPQCLIILCILYTLLATIFCVTLHTYHHCLFMTAPSVLTIFRCYDLLFFNKSTSDDFTSSLF